MCVYLFTVAWVAEREVFFASHVLPRNFSPLVTRSSLQRACLYGSLHWGPRARRTNHHWLGWSQRPAAQAAVPWPPHPKLILSSLPCGCSHRPQEVLASIPVLLAFLKHGQNSEPTSTPIKQGLDAKGWEGLSHYKGGLRTNVEKLRSSLESVKS